jgi:hypothetical protein
VLATERPVADCSRKEHVRWNHAGGNREKSKGGVHGRTVTVDEEAEDAEEHASSVRAIESAR